MLEFYRLWIEILFGKVTVEKLAQETGLKKGLENLFFSTVLISALLAIFTVFYINVKWELEPSMQTILFLAGLDVIKTFVGSLVVLILFGVFYFFAKALGGKGNYKSYVGTLALIWAAVSGTAIALSIIMANLFSIFTQYSAISGFALLANIIIFLYFLYLCIKVTQSVHQISGLKAAAIILVPMVIILLAIAVVFGPIWVGETLEGYRSMKYP